VHSGWWQVADIRKLSIQQPQFEHSQRGQALGPVAFHPTVERPLVRGRLRLSEGVVPWRFPRLLTRSPTTRAGAGTPARAPPSGSRAGRQT
jgi:hypothetical protein